MYHYDGIILIDDGVIATYSNNKFTVTKITAININITHNIDYITLPPINCITETINFDTFNAYNVKVTIPGSTIYRIYEFVFPTSYTYILTFNDTIKL